VFTGIVQRVGAVAWAGEQSGGKRVAFGSTGWTDIALGESIAVNGVCLTVAHVSGDAWTADISEETARRSTLGSLRPGSRVNLERALRLGDRLGGHIVQGHVDEVGQVVRCHPSDRGMELTVRTSEAGLRYVAEKGSVAVDGVSLTIAAVSGRDFVVSLVPFTLAATTLSERKPGDLTNIEFDVLSKYIERLLRAGNGSEPRSGLDLATLQEHGFV